MSGTRILQCSLSVHHEILVYSHPYLQQYIPKLFSQHSDVSLYDPEESQPLDKPFLPEIIVHLSNYPQSVCASLFRRFSMEKRLSGWKAFFLLHFTYL